MTREEHRTKVLKKLKFEKDRSKKHEIWFLKSASGTIWRRTVVSHGNGEIYESLKKQYRQQIGPITPQEYDEIAACNMSKEEYYKKLFNSETIPEKEEQKPNKTKSKTK